MRPPLRNTVSPNQPFATDAYSKQYVDTLNNILRLYFNTIDAFTGALVSNTGGAYLGLPHVAASGSTDQYAAGNDTPTIVTWNTLDSGNGFVLNADNTATALVSGVYKIDYSLQLTNSDNLAHDAVIWLKIDGVNVANSTSKFTVAARKSAGVPSYLVAYSSVVFQILEGQKVGLWWATDLAATSGGGLGIKIEYEAAQTSPYSHPAVPSAIGSITFVSRINP